MLTVLAIENYRSLRHIVMPLGRLNVVTGANGSGKSSIYRALRLLGEIAQGRVIPTLAREGGLQSTLWAGPEKIGRDVRAGRYPVQGTLRDKPVNLRLGFADESGGYQIDLGLPIPSSSKFSRDPEIKRECVWVGSVWRPSGLIVDRNGPHVRTRALSGAWRDADLRLAGYDSALTQLADPREMPESFELRERIRNWRFYDHFRSDTEAPARRPQIGTHTPILSADGHDLAAAIQTIVEIGDSEALRAVVEDAFPGSSLQVEENAGSFELIMSQHGLLRPLRMSEVSDGTLRYLLWIAALLTARPPELLVLNEPETSLHPSLLPPLARLIGRAAKRSQIIVVSHAGVLMETLADMEACRSIMLEKEFGETFIAGMDRLDQPPWQWAGR